MEGLGQDNPDPDDDVGGQEVHHAQVGDSSAEVNLESRVGHDYEHLTNKRNSCLENWSQLYSKSVTCSMINIFEKKLVTE